MKPRPAPPVAHPAWPPRSDRPARARCPSGAEVVNGGLIELWAHKLRSILTLTLLMLGVFALVVMTSVMDGVMDKIATGFSGMSWDGTVMLAPKAPATTEEQKRFAMSPGLRYEDLAAHRRAGPMVLAFLPRATKRSVVKVAGGTERMFVNGVWPDYSRWMNRPIAMGRGLTDDDERRRSTVAVVGATLASKLFGGADPVGRDITVEGVRFRIIGVQAPSQILPRSSGTTPTASRSRSRPTWTASTPRHQLANVAVKVARSRDTAEVSAMMVGRAKQAHHGIEDVEIKDLEAEAARAWQHFIEQIAGWRVVLTSLAATVLLVGGVGVLSVMLISFSDRRYEIGLRKAMGASDGEILVQFLLEACVLAAVGATFGTFLGAVVCKALSATSLTASSSTRSGSLIAWVVALVARPHLRPLPRRPRLAPVPDGGHAVAPGRSANSLPTKEGGGLRCGRPKRGAGSGERSRPHPAEPLAGGARRAQSPSRAKATAPTPPSAPRASPRWRRCGKSGVSSSASASASPPVPESAGPPSSRPCPASSSSSPCRRARFPQRKV